MRSRRVGAAGIFALAAVPRLLHLALAPIRFDDWQWGLATSLLTRGTLEHEGATTDFEPLYPLFVAAIRSVVGDRPALVLLVQGAVASLGAVLLFRLAEALSGSRRVGVSAGVLFAVYPLLIRHATDGTESALLATFLIAFAWAFVTAKTTGGAALAGTWLGLATLTRSMVLPLVPLSIALMLWDGRRRAAVGLLCAILVMAPWAVRNYSLNGTLLPTRLGLNLFISNSSYNVIPEYPPDILGDYAGLIASREGFERAIPSPEIDRAADEMYLRFALREVSSHPWRTAWLKTKNLWYFFSPRLVPYYDLTDDTYIVLDENGAFHVEHAEPRPVFHQLAYTVPYVFVLVMIAVAFASRRVSFRRDAILWGIVGVFAAVQTIYFPTMRYRVPVEFALLYYAAVGMDALMVPLKPDATIPETVAHV